MPRFAGPLYELTIAIDEAVGAEAEAWLRDALDDVSIRRGILAARLLAERRIEDGRSIRICQFQAEDEEAMDELLSGPLAALEASAEARFGDGVEIEARVLTSDDSVLAPDGQSLNCRNCGTRLGGQYCGNCGQRARDRLISIWELLREAFGDLLELDSRLWRTLLPLLRRPGRLTRDYLEGRRARYMPPFRTYLVLSVIFFVVAFFNPREDLSLFFEPRPADEAATDAELEEASEALRELRNSGKLSDEVIAEIIDDDDELNINIGPGKAENGESGLFDNCDEASIADEEDIPDWIKSRFTDERIKELCERNKARGIENFGEALLDNVPIALIVLLPAMALVLKILYPLSRRYFVEHLLFFIHFHAFFFLLLTLLILFSRLVAWVRLEGAISTIVVVASSFYIPVYLYKAMRYVYGQGHMITIVKYVVLLAAYLTGVTMTMFTAFLFALMSA